jgi:hypothetical protein
MKTDGARILHKSDATAFFAAISGDARIIGPKRHFGGDVIFGVVESAAQIAWDYNRGKPVGWWKMDEGEGDKAYDSSGNGATGTLNNLDPPSDWVDGKFGESVDFDSGNDNISASSTSTLKPTPFLSFGAWVKLDTVLSSQPSGFAMVLDKYDTGGSGYGILFTKASDQLTCRFAGGGLKDVSTSGAGALFGTDWHHIMCTYDGSARKIYVDGVQKNSTSESFTQTQNDENLYIGSYDGSLYAPNGQIDDVRVYNYALTAEQIKQVMNEGSAIRFGE